MAFDGNLLYIGSGNTPFPNDYIFKESYNIAPAQRQDVDSGLNGNQVLLRNVAAHTRSKIEFNTISDIDNTELKMLCKLFSDNYIDDLERKVSISYYNPETDEYDTGVFYKPDITYAIKRVIEQERKVIYASVKMTLIEY